MNAAEMITTESMQSLLDRQKKAFLKDGPVSADLRIDRLNRTIALLVDHQKELCDAMSVDFGHRSTHQSLMADIYGAVEPLKHARKHVKQWMKHEKRKPPFPLGLFGAKAQVEYQPKGVVGAISAWNFPVWVPFCPLAGIFAAGNRSMVKLSEFTPETSTLLQNLIGQYFDQEELVGINGGPEVGAEFSALPFDHMIFTGATSIGKHIMRAAADNLVPVTLELGGKSPTIVGKDADLKKTARKIMVGKILNVGQVCLSPDYVFVPKKHMNEFIALCETEFASLFADLKNNPDYGSVVNQRHFDRLQSYLDDARAKNGEIRELNPANENFNDQQGTYKIPLTMVIDPSDDMKVMQEEIFGPLLPIKGYDDIQEVIDYVNANPRPLALYYFGDDKAEQRNVLDHTHSGGVTINDVIQHVATEDLPFGGVGDSGMGNYHGHDGFKTFSHPRSVYKQAKVSLMELAGLVPPYGTKAEKAMKAMIKK